MRTESPPTSASATQSLLNDESKAGRNNRQSFGPVRYPKYVLYETKARFWLIGSNRKKTQFSLIKIDRTCESQLEIIEDGCRYTRQEIQALLRMIAEGNASTGGLHRRCSAYGILGFIRFLHGYYLLLVTKRKKVASIGVHDVYKVVQISDLAITHPSWSTQNTGKGWMESKYRTLFFSMALKHFYFSYSYDLTRTLQNNMTAEQKHRNVYNEGFVWNEFLLQDLIRATSRDSPWVLPMIHGYLKENKFSLNGRICNIVLIARRSRHFAGTRFLKRGVNERGQVANAVECEQIVYDASSEVAHLPHSFTSYVQIRGSIPLFWGQDGSVLAPKPPIAIQRVDPFYTATILHFEDLLRQFGAPIIVLNLVKQNEKKPRESLLGEQYRIAVDEINGNIPSALKIEFVDCDFSHFSKQIKGPDVVAVMNDYAEAALQKTGYFHAGCQRYSNYLNGDENPEPGWAPYRAPDIPGRFQTGLVRSNCIDSLDRTNAAQFITGKVAFGYQLCALGLSMNPECDFDDPVVQILLDMYQGMGNTLALQYGGSRLAHTISTYREKTFANHSRDLLASLKRFYSNSFTDKEKQDSINLFLGNFCPWNEKVNLWDLETDYHLHMKKAESFPETFLFTNQKWWEPALKVFFSRIISSPLLPIGNPRDAYLSRLYEEIYEPYRITSFDLIISRQCSTPIPIAVPDTSPSQSFQAALRRTGGNSNNSNAATTGSATSSAAGNGDRRMMPASALPGTTNQARKGQMLLSLYGIKKWFTFVQDSVKTVSTRKKKPGDSRVSVRTRRTSSGSSFDLAPSPYEIFTRLDSDESLRLDCLPVSVAPYIHYLSFSQTSLDTIERRKQRPKKLRRTASIRSTPPSLKSPVALKPATLLQTSASSASSSSSAFLPAEPNARLPGYLQKPPSPSRTAVYADAVSIASLSTLKSMPVNDSAYVAALDYCRDLRPKDLTCSRETIGALCASFETPERIAETGLFTGWLDAKSILLTHSAKTQETK